MTVDYPPGARVGGGGGRPFLSLRLLTAAWWASFFAATWIDILLMDINSSVIVFFAGAVLASILCFVTYSWEHTKTDE